MTQVITHFEGDPKGFKEWIKAVETYALLTQADTDKVKLIAYESCKGAVIDYRKIYLTEYKMPNDKVPYHEKYNTSAIEQVEKRYF